MTHQERLPIFRCKNVNIRGILGECTGIESWICMGVTRQTATSCSNVGGRHKRGGKFFQWRYGAILHLKYYLGDIWKFSYISFIILSNVAKQLVMANSDILLMASSDILFKKTPVDIETYVVKQLASCDPILKRHRKQALRVTALHIAASYLWVGTTAGVILSIGEIILLWLIVMRIYESSV